MNDMFISPHSPRGTTWTYFGSNELIVSNMGSVLSCIWRSNKVILFSVYKKQTNYLLMFTPILVIYIFYYYL